jgi:pimeloyl-ACP methyl ester carboxylesterase
MSEGAGAVFAEMAGGTGEELTPDELRRLSMPASVLAGADTAPFLRAAAERLSSLVPAIRLQQIPGANHLLPVANPERFVERVRPLI